MEPIKRMFIKEAFQDNNFGDGMFKGAADADDDLINQSDLSKGNRKIEKRQLALFQRNIMIEFRKQIKVSLKTDAHYIAWLEVLKYHRLKLNNQPIINFRKQSGLWMILVAGLLKDLMTLLEIL